MIRALKNKAVSIAGVALVATAMLATPSPAAAAPIWDLRAHHNPTYLSPGVNAEFAFAPKNRGLEMTGGTTTLQIDPLPAGLAASYLNVAQYDGFVSTSWSCDLSSLKCETSDPIPPLAPTSTVLLGVEVDPDASGELGVSASLSSGDSPSVATAVESALVSTASPSFGIEAESFLADAFDEEFQPARQAGEHPVEADAEFDFNTALFDPPPFLGYNEPVGTVRQIQVDLPRGFVGNPQAVAECSADLLHTQLGYAGSACPPDSQVGTIDLLLTIEGQKLPLHVPVYNMEPPKGAVAAFAFAYLSNPAWIVASLDPRDYSVVTTVSDINETFGVRQQSLALWGNPADPVHDPQRYNPDTEIFGAPFSGTPRPFISLPTECGVKDSAVLTRLSPWQDPSVNAAGGLAGTLAQMNGCNQLEFDPAIVSRPSTNLADAPTGLEFEMRIPQNEDPEGRATSHLRDAVVKLPAGMTVNPPSADGLGACSLAQIGISASGVPNGNPVACPDSSKLGRVEAITPALENPVKGTVYLAEQTANPFNSLLAMYIVVEDKERGLLVKLPGKVDADPHTGQLTATFKNNPQLPVEELALKLKEGPRAALKTPSACGTHTTNATLTPWSSPEGADAKEQSSFQLIGGPSGGACLPSGAGAPNTQSFTAGTLDPTAKAFTPFSLKLTRADGTQQLKAIDTTLPKGLLGKLAGTTYCSDGALAAAASKPGKAERAAPSCPPSSQVGSVNVGAGAGSTPLYVGGTAYLAGPYKGAPLSLAIITPAVAGPFDLGTVVVRTALQVNPESAQIHAVSDELPTILQGIPLNIRSVALKMDRPQFTLNPTSCDPMAITGSALSVFNQPSALTSPFQVGECNKLAFKPKLAINLKGGTKRSQFPALTAILTARPGDANIAKTVVALPRSEFLAQSHIRTICTRVQYAAEACPAGSIYGKATAWSPLLDQPLSGPVYLRSSSNELPDMVVALNGQIDVDLVGRIDTANRGIRTTFDTVPDAPVSKFVLQMQGGKKGLLENSRNLCATTNKASVQMQGQNGAAFESKPVLKSKGCKKVRKSKKSKSRGKPAKKG